MAITHARGGGRGGILEPAVARMMRRRTGHVVAVDIVEQLRAAKALDRATLVAAIVLTLFFGAVAYRWAPAPLPIAATLLVVMAVTAFVRPGHAVYAILLFGLIGDGETLDWWPFTSAFSQRESILFLHDSLPITPIDVVLGAAFFALLTRRLADRTWTFKRGKLFGPIAVFGSFVVLATLRGLLLGGNTTVVLLQARPVVYCIAVYILITNEFSSARQYRIAFALALVATAIQSIFTLEYFRRLPAERRIGLESLGEHSGALIMNVVVMTFIVLLTFRGSRWRKWAMVPMLIPITYAYLLAQRRAAMVALIVGLVLLAVLVFLRSRRLFWKYVPALSAMALLFVGATWNSSGTLGLASTAVKTMFFPDSLPAAERASDLYRVSENYNLWVTVKSNFVLGLGFGRPFTVVWPMPNLSAFRLWQYFPHNSVLGMYINLGVGGFIATLFLFGRAVQRGVRAAIAQRNPDDASMALAAAAYPLMFLVFAFVDIAWGIRPLLMLGLCFAICSDFPGDAASSPEPPRAMAVRSIDRGKIGIAA